MEPESASQYEHPHDAVGVVGVLLERVPTLTILVTSRHLLRLSQEREFSVPPLQTISRWRHDLKWNLSTLDKCESVRLFVERAQDARRDFQLTSENGATILELCNRLECIPLAIELAAARVKLLKPAEILKQLGDRFNLLTTRNPDIPARHCSMRAALDTSLALLTPPLQRFLAQLSIFRGGWTWEAAESVCQRGDGYILDHLEKLRDCSLIQTVEFQGEIRFRMLETVREYAEQQLIEHSSTTDRILLREAHFAYFLDMATRSENELTGPEQADWLNRLDSEHDNLRAALRTQPSAEQRLQMAGTLYRFWDRRDHFQEGRSWLELASTANDISPSVRAKALNGAGILADKQGDYLAARAFLEQSLELYTTLNRPDGIARASNNLGNVLDSQGRYQEAQSCYEEAVRIWERLNSRPDLASALSNLGIIHRSLGAIKQAESCYRRSLQLSRDGRDAMQEAATLLGLGNMFRSQNRFEEAQDCFEESLKLFRKLGRKTSIAIALLNLGGLVHKLQGYVAAWPLLTESLQIRDEINDLRGIPTALEEMAEVLHDEQQYSSATQLLGAATTLRSTFRTPLSAARDSKFQKILQTLRINLGEETFQTVWQQGFALNREEVIRYACDLGRK